MPRVFDYIVVGAGSAGAVVASRLSEDKDISVLLLEAGGTDRHPLQLMPIAFQRVLESPAYNWQFESEPEPGLYGRRLPIPEPWATGVRRVARTLERVDRGNGVRIWVPVTLIRIRVSPR